MKVKAFYPTVYQGTLDTAIQAMKDSQYDRAASLENSDNKQQEHNQFKPR